MKKEINVHIGEIKIAKNGETLKAILGSCVGIGIVWKSKGICGLAHCLLPESQTPTSTIGGRFVNQAIPSLLALMKIQPENYPDIEVVLVGGGNMIYPNARDKDALVGSVNLKVAEREIKRLGLPLIYCEGRGDEGRKILIDSSTGTFQVDKIPRFVKAVSGDGHGKKDK